MRVSTTHNRRKAGSATRPGIGFLGVGWIGKHRLDVLLKSQYADVVSICDPYAEDTITYCEEHDLVYSNSFDELLEQDIEGVVIATPTALHAAQVLKALERGKAVFCQKPLACDLYSTAQIIDLAKQKDLLLMIDYPYRYTDALMKIRQQIDAGALGDIFAIRATFHKSHGPDQKWYSRKGLSGGGCVMDLGVHLIDVIYWMFPQLFLRKLSADLFAGGKRLPKFESTVEDYAMIHIQFEQDVTAELECSWHSHAGADATATIEFHGTKGGACFRNVQGSLYDFKAEIFDRSEREVISMPPDDWTGRAALDWASMLEVSPHYQNETELYLKTAEIVDFIYSA